MHTFFLEINRKKSKIIIIAIIVVLLLFGTQLRGLAETIEGSEIIHDEESEFNAGEQERTEVTSDPKVQIDNPYPTEELQADEHTVALYHFNEDSWNGTVGEVKDSSGNNSHGTAVNGLQNDPQSVGRFKSTGNFDGVDDFIQINNDPLGTNYTNYTIEVWINTSYNSRQSILYRGNSSGENPSTFWINDNSRLVFDVYPPLGGGLIGNSVVTDGKWHFVAAVRNGSNHYLYIDGQLDAWNEEAESYSGSLSDSIRIGMRRNLTFPFHGMIDEIRISNIARTSEEIQKNAQLRPYGEYKSGTIDLGSRPDSIDTIQWEENDLQTGYEESIYSRDGLVGEWLFDEKSGDMAYDSSGNENNGSLIGFTDTSGQDATSESGWTFDNRKKGDGGMMFNEDNQIIQAGNSSELQITGSFTTSAWINAEYTATSNQSFIISKWRASSQKSWGFSLTKNFPGLEIDKYHVACVLSQDGTTQTLTAVTNRYLPNIEGYTGWHNIVCAYDSNTPDLKIYVDGEEWTWYEYWLPSINIPSSIHNSTEQLKIGNYHLINDEYEYEGYMDSVRLWNHTLPADEILYNYQNSNIEFQTRTSADGENWNEWSPSNEEQILSMDNDNANWTWDETSDNSPLTKENESNIKIKGTGSEEIHIGETQVDANTVALWHLDETNDDLPGYDIFDATSNNNDGEINGTTVVDGIQGKAREFDGVDEKIEIWDTSQINSRVNTSTGSAEAWFYLQSDSDGAVFTYFSNNNDRLYCNINSGNLRIGIGDRYQDIYSLEQNQWYYVAFTWEQDGSVEVYVNGKFITQFTFTNPGFVFQGSQMFNLGYAWTGNPIYLNGLIDEVRISNVARTPEEIAENYRMGRDHYLSRDITITDVSENTKLPFWIAADEPGSYLEATIGESAFANGLPDENTVGLWHMDEANDVTDADWVKDSSGNDRHGTLGSAMSLPNSVNGYRGKAREFKGGTNNINLGNDSTLQSLAENQFSVSAWVKPTTNGTDRIIAGNAYSTGGWSIRLRPNNELRMLLVTTPFVWNYSDTESLELNKWSYVVGTWDGTGTVRTYVNGIEETSQYNQGTLSNLTSSYDTFIGRTGDVSLPYVGLIDEVRIDNIARTPEEIRQAYERGRRTHPIIIDFSASLDPNNLIVNSSDTTFIIDGTTKGYALKGENIYPEDIIIIKEKYGDTEYIAQGDIRTVNQTTGEITVTGWYEGSTFPPIGFSEHADVFKWQQEWMDLRGALPSDRDEISRIDLKITDGNEGRTVWIDDIKKAGPYLTDPTATNNIFSSAERYLQYRAIVSTYDSTSIPYFNKVTISYQSIYDTELLSPINNKKIAEQKPVLEWGKTQAQNGSLHNEVNHYEIYIDGELIDEVSSNTAEYHVTEKLDIAEHTWQIIAKRSDNIQIDESDMETFEIVKTEIELQSPIDDSEIETFFPELDWKLKDDITNDEIDYYEVYIDGEKIKTVSKNDTKYEIEEALSHGQHEWHIKAYDEEDDEIAESDKETFIIQEIAVELIAPINGIEITDRTPQLQWDTTYINIHHYEINLNNDLYVTTVDNSTNYQITTALEIGTYTWEIIAYAENNVEIGRSMIETFKIMEEEETDDDNEGDDGGGEEKDDDDVDEEKEQDEEVEDGDDDEILEEDKKNYEEEIGEGLKINIGKFENVRSIIREEYQEEIGMANTGVAVITGLLSLFGFDSFYNLFIALTNTLNRMVGVVTRRKTRIYGKVRDKRTQRPIAKAIITILTANSEKVAGRCITNKRGEYSYYIQPGRYKIEVLGRGVKFRKGEEESRKGGYEIEIKGGEEVEINFSVMIPEGIYRKSKVKNVVKVGGNVLFYAGSIFSVGVFILFPGILNGCICLWYVFLWVMRRFA